MNSELDALMQRYVDAEIDAPSMRRLNALLAEDAVARREFAELLNVDSALAAMAAGCGSEHRSEPVARSVIVHTPQFRRAAVWVAAAAASVALMLAGWWWHSARQIFATVERVAGAAEWREGVAVKGERHELVAGAVSLVTLRGARLVIEAPATFRFESPQRLRLWRGRVAADVPPAAKGFTVVTPSGDAVDLGTRFGVDVPVSGDAEIHVFEGEVIAHAHGATNRQSLRTGEAITMAAGGSATRELRSAAFIQHDEVSGLTAGLAAGQKARAEAALAEWRRDPALIALLDFETPEGQPGVYRTVQGRWPGSQAPEFVQVGDHLKLDAGGGRDWPQLTLAAWVRLDQLGAPYQSLLHTDGWNASSPGQVHWMVTRHSTMRLALFGNTLAPGSEEMERFPDSRASVLPERGRWVHLATVYDSTARTVRFFLNGHFDKETHLDVAHPARLGPAQIGNWDRQDRKLSGRVDELILLGRTVSDSEVRALFEAGNPYR